MQKLLLALVFSSLVSVAQSQNLSSRLAKAYKIFESDSQLKNSIASLYVIDGSTGKTIFDKNSSIGLAPASTQKIITAATAYELLGKDFRYRTIFGYTGTIAAGQLKGRFYVRGSGDPSLGSWRWKSTSENAVVSRVVAAIRKLGIQEYQPFIVDDSGWEGEMIPDGWIWQDIGNYYGAGAGILNWRENQYDLVLRSGSAVGSPVSVVSSKPVLYGYNFQSYATAGDKGSGDNAYIYFPAAASQILVRGTIPVNEERFVIAGAMPSPQKQLLATVRDSLTTNRQSAQGPLLEEAPAQKTPAFTVFHEERSPSLDSLVYWFLRRSINLYGEALVKTFANNKGKQATTDNGVEIVRNFWKDKGIPPTALNMVDGSGLSPQNRVTTAAQVAVLQYASRQPWFDGYYLAFPEFNAMKMKSGTIGGAKAFCGYHRSSTGQSFIFSFIVNNYNGSSSSLVQKMYKVLDELK